MDYWTIGTTALEVCVFALLAVAGVFVPYFLLRRLLGTKLSDDTQTLSSSVVVRLGALHALILALVFAQEQRNYTEVRRTVTEEAAATADVFYALGRYGEGETESARRALARYVKTVVEAEWPALAHRQLSPLAWELYTEVDLALYRLEPTVRMDEDIRAQMLEDWDAVSEMRRAREMAANHHVPVFFWVVAVLGFVLLSMPYFAFSPSTANLGALAAFAIYNGIVFYFIVSIGNPFAGPAPLEPTAFERVLADEGFAMLARGA